MFFYKYLLLILKTTFLVFIHNFCYYFHRLGTPTIDFFNANLYASCFQWFHDILGLLVYDHYKLAMNYIRSSRFILDIICLTPLDLLQIKFGSIPILRFPRFFKVYRTIQLYHLQESRTVYPNTYRVLNLIHILLLLGHWLASFYFMVSKAEGFVGHWSYPKPVGSFSELTKMYLRCLYWSTLTLTTIGDLPPPETNWQ